MTTIETSQRRAEARVPMLEPRGIFGRLVSWLSRRTYGGEVPDVVLTTWNHPGVFRASLGMEFGVSRLKSLDPDLKTLAVMSSAAVIGCSWCLDFGYYAAHSEGLDTSRLREVPRWRDSGVFSPLERQVMEYAEAMTATPPEVTDEMAATLRDALGVKAFVELTMMVAVENERSRMNAALGLRSQGFADRCEVPVDRY
ncbi:carboxymuconolactone decarboxylase family protein [Nocardioides sp. Bht2]|uniref:carboxymuconolactone decarboxylase family protein n=1 Tax=Nocardioides sp. Bht2 TaxID=3392297 RepID=UPI0039B4F5AF